MPLGTGMLTVLSGFSKVRDGDGVGNRILKKSIHVTFREIYGLGV